MQITVTGRHFEITDPLKQHIETKLNKLDRYLDGLIDAHVVLSVEKHRHIAEINLQANGNLLRGVEEKHDMYLAVDTVIDKIERQVKRQKDKEADRKGRFAIKSTDMVPTQPIDTEEFKTPPKVIRTQRMAIKPMSIDEAAMQLGLTKEDFLAFLNSETDQMNVMYKRRDGNYGLIEPEF